MISRFIIILWAAFALSYTVRAQDPVRWTYTATRLDSHTFEVHLTATLADGWHIYAQDQPEEAIAVPTRIDFKANPLVTAIGKPREVGKKEVQKVDVIDIKQFQYAHSVDFVQKITLKAAVKTSFSGTVTFQACTDKQCLPPKEEAFNFLL